MDELVREKIQDNFVNTEWNADIQREMEKQEYRETALKLIKKALIHEDLHEIKEIIQELEDEIGEV